MSYQKQILMALLLVLLVTVPGCFMRMGETVGGVAGAGVGLTAGAVTLRPAQGAETGAICGAVCGAVVGGAIDSALTMPIWLPKKLFEREKPGLTTERIIAMHEEGASDDFIIREIELLGMRDRLDAGNAKKLAEANISNQVLVAVQRANSPAGEEAPPMRTRRPESDPIWRTAADSEHAGNRQPDPSQQMAQTPMMYPKRREQPPLERPPVFGDHPGRSPFESGAFAAGTSQVGAPVGMPIMGAGPAPRRYPAPPVRQQPPTQRSAAKDPWDWPTQ